MNVLSGSSIHHAYSIAAPLFQPRICRSSFVCLLTLSSTPIFLFIYQSMYLSPMPCGLMKFLSRPKVFPVFCFLVIPLSIVSLLPASYLISIPSQFLIITLMVSPNILFVIFHTLASVILIHSHHV